MASTVEQRPARRSPESMLEAEQLQLENLRLISENLHYMRKDLEATKDKVSNINSILMFFGVLFILGGILFACSLLAGF